MLGLVFLFSKTCIPCRWHVTHAETLQPLTPKARSWRETTRDARGHHAESLRPLTVVMALTTCLQPQAGIFASVCGLKKTYIYINLLPAGMQPHQKVTSCCFLSAPTMNGEVNWHMERNIRTRLRKVNRFYKWYYNITSALLTRMSEMFASTFVSPRKYCMEGTLFWWWPRITTPPSVKKMRQD